MNRIEELTFRLLDGVLSGEEQEELDRLLTMEEAVRRHMTLLELEAALRAAGPVPDMAGATAAHLETMLADDLERSVMHTIATLPAPPWAPVERVPVSFRQRLWIGSLVLGVSAALLLAVLLLWHRDPDHPRANDLGSIPSPLLLDRSTDVVVLDCSTDVVVEPAPGKPVTPALGVQFHAGQTLRVSEAGYAVLGYSDGTRLELSGAVSLRASPNNSTKRVRLDAGSLRASVQPQPNDQPLVVITPHTELFGGNGSFQVNTADEQGTRIDMDTGSGQLVRPGQSPVALAAGTSAFVPAKGPAVFLPRSSFRLQPVREMVFPDLRMVDFSPDGRTLFGATRYQSVYWQESDRIEAVPVSPRGRKGADIEMLAGSTLAVIERADHRVRIWDVWKREPRMLVDPLPSGRLVALSPEGDWLAFWEAENHRLRLLYTASGRVTLMKFEQKVYAFAAAPNGLLAVARRNPAPSARLAVDLVDVAGGRVTDTLLIRGEPAIVLACSKDGRHLAVGTHGKVQVWAVTERRILSTLDQPGYPMLRVALSDDGKTLAAAGLDDRVWLWDVNRSVELGILRPGKRPPWLAFSPDGKTLAVLAQGARVTLWTVPQ